MKAALLIALVAVSSACSPAALVPASVVRAPSAARAGVDDTFPIGVSPGSGFEQTFAGMSPARQHAVLKLMKSDGVAWLRIDYYPNDTALRHFILVAQSEGLKVDALLEDFGATPGRFAIFAREAVAQLGCDAYEILNEVNLHQPQISAAKYVPVLKAAYAAIKEADPHAVVLASGLGPGSGQAEPANYLQAMYAAGAKGYFDAANLHPYSFPAMPMSSPCQWWNTFCHGAPAMHEVMVKNGDGDKTIWFTEFGCPTGSGGGYPKVCTYEGLADQLTQAYMQSRNWAWAGAFFVFDWKDNGVDGDFGLYLANGNPKPYALKAFENFR